MSKPDFIASDVHLGPATRERERTFLAFLEHIGAQAGTLLINGDLFDFWFEYGRVIPGTHFRVLAALADLVDSGVRVTLIGGNHDAWGGRFLRDDVGVEFHTGLLRTSFAGRPALVAHGDGLGKGDFRYRALKSIVRSRAIIGLFRAIHPEIGLRIAQGVSRTETRQDEDVSRNRAAFLQSWGTAQLTADPTLAYVLCGHAHRPACVEVEPGRYYLNAGDFIKNFTYIVVTPDGRPTLEQWRQRG
jgi:UDP-2,3-diacylglucosamine hydrolase